MRHRIDSAANPNERRGKEERIRRPRRERESECHGDMFICVCDDLMNRLSTGTGRFDRFVISESTTRSPSLGVTAHPLNEGYIHKYNHTNKKIQRRKQMKRTDQILSHAYVCRARVKCDSN